MPQVRIARYGEFDNGHVLRNYKRMDIEENEENNWYYNNEEDEESNENYY